MHRSGDNQRQRTAVKVACTRRDIGPPRAERNGCQAECGQAVVLEALLHGIRCKGCHSVLPRKLDDLRHPAVGSGEPYGDLCEGDANEGVVREVGACARHAAQPQRIGASRHRPGFVERHIGQGHLQRDRRQPNEARAKPERRPRGDNT